MFSEFLPMDEFFWFLTMGVNELNCMFIMDYGNIVLKSVKGFFNSVGCIIF